MGTGSDQSSVRSWLVQPIKELSSAAGLCAGKGCALIRQLANWSSGQLQTARFMYNEQKCSFFYCVHTFKACVQFHYCYMQHSFIIKITKIG